jgi:hypothetical protein
MTNLEIKHKLDIIISKISDNTIWAWNSNLEETTEAIATEDYYGNLNDTEPSVEYNGWLEDLDKLREEIISL